MAILLITRHLRESVAPRARYRVDWLGALGLFLSGGLLIVALVDGGAAFAAALALVILLAVTPRRFPVLPDGG